MEDSKLTLDEVLNREDVVEWQQLMEMHGLTHIFNDKETDVTALIPTNGAVNNSPFWNDLVYRTSAEYALHRHHVLLLHFIDVGEGLDSTDFFQSQQLRTAAGEIITAELSESSVVGFRGLGDLQEAGNIVVADLIAANGVAHVIDKVLLPDFWAKNVVQLMESRPGLSTFANYLREIQQLMSAATSSAAVTMLIPTNQAFSDLGPRAMELLMSDSTLVESVAANHLLPQKIAAMEELQFLQPLTVFSNEKLVVTVGETGSLQDSLQVNGSSILEADILVSVCALWRYLFLQSCQANNGLVHVIDAVLLNDEQKRLLSIDEQQESDSSTDVPPTRIPTDTLTMNPTPTTSAPMTLAPTSINITQEPSSATPIPPIRSPTDTLAIPPTTTAPTIEKLRSTAVPTQSTLVASTPTTGSDGLNTSNVTAFPLGPLVGGTLGAVLIVCITILIGLRMWIAQRQSSPSSTDPSPMSNNAVVAVPVGPEVSAVLWTSGIDDVTESDRAHQTDKKPQASKIAKLRYKQQAQ